MKIAICTSGKSPEATVSNRFGRAEYFAVYNVENNNWTYINNQQDTQAVQGAGIQAAQAIIDSGADILLAANVGPKAMKALSVNKIKVYGTAASKTIAQQIELYKEGKLEEISEANVEGHWV